MGDFVPAKAHKPLVILRTIPPDHHIRLKICLPLHLIGRGGRPPFGIIGRCMSLGPNMVPAIQRIALLLMRSVQKSVIESELN